LLLFKRFIADVNIARTVAFSSLVVFELARLHTIRSSYNLGPFSNKYLIGAVIISLLLQVFVVYTPLNIFFKTVPIGLVEWAYILGAAVIMLVLGSISVPIIRKITKEED
jgi:Ca2+-transporting ATPase